MPIRDHKPASSTLSVAITGSGGSGVVTAGQMLLRAAANAGLFGLMHRSSGPQIRGGESAAMLRVGSDPVTCQDDSYDIMIAFDWLNVDRFIDEIRLTPDSLVIADPDEGEVPESIKASGPRILAVPLKKLSEEVEGGRPNMVGLGVLADLLKLPADAISTVVGNALKRKGEAAVKASQACVRKGFDQEKATRPTRVLASVEQPPARWNISGNEASGLGALRGGVRFVAAYPITPASEILEWLAPNLERVGGSLLQAEDELASINMIIGASFGGVPAMTATSGPGLSLMMEGLGLAVTSETPVVVSNVMRGGPSTGIPTKSEQSDLNIALYGFHGDAPHLVLAALDIRDCVFSTHWAVELAEHLQAVAIVLSDQSQGQARAIVPPPKAPPKLPPRKVASAGDAPYMRYAVTEDGISPMAIPGTPGCIHTADGLEHNPRGTPSSMAADHQVQLDKRLRKLELHDYGDAWAEIRGSGGTCILTWGSSSGASFEAAQRLTGEAQPTRAIAVRLLAPLQVEALRNAIDGADHVLVVEQNHGAQFFHYLRSRGVLDDRARSLARPGPLPIRPGEIVNFLKEWS